MEAWRSRGLKERLKSAVALKSFTRLFERMAVCTLPLSACNTESRCGTGPLATQATQPELEVVSPHGSTRRQGPDGERQRCESAASSRGILSWK